MAKLLDGKQVAAALNEKIKTDVSELQERGVLPTLAIVRVGEKGDLVAYERGATKRCEMLGAGVRSIILPEDVPQKQLLDTLSLINEDDLIHGCLMLRPLPAHIDDCAVRNALCSEKDVDGITDGSIAGVFTGTCGGFPPCTAKACIEILDHFGVELKGKRVAVIGRSIIVGKPVSMMLMSRHATVTICHTRTVDMPEICRNSEILIVAAGSAGIVDKNFFSPGQVVIDVGINVDENGKLRGDVDFAAAEQVVEAITPVPGGVGSVTTSVLVSHVVETAKSM